MDKIRKNILVIEDNYDLWKNTLRNVFPGEAGYNLISSIGNNNIFQVLQDNNITLADVSLVLSDYFLGNENGVQWVERNIKTYDRTLPVIFWTSSMDVQIIKETVSGEHVFFKKDLNLAKLKEIADQLINERVIQTNYPLFNARFNTWIRPEIAKNRELCYKAYTNVSRYLEGFFGHSKYHAVFNTHGLVHAQNVVNNLAKLMMLAHDYFREEEGNKDYYFVLAYLGALFHDLGMIPKKYDKNVEFADFKRTRENHAIKGAYLVLSGELEKMLELNFDDYLTDSKTFKLQLALVCLYHGANQPLDTFVDIAQFYKIKSWEEQEGSIGNSIFSATSNWEEMINRLNNNDKLRTLTALVALADKLDSNITRMPVGPVRESPHRSLRDEFEYIKNECFDSYRIINSIKGPEIEIDIASPDIEDFEPAEEKYFERFIKLIDNNEGNITDECIKYASEDLKHGVIERKWENIKTAICESTDTYLRNLQLKFSPINKEIEEFKSPVNVLLPGNNVKFGEEKLNDFEKSLFRLIFPENYKARVTQVGEGFSSEKVFIVNNIHKKTKSGTFYRLQNKIVKIGEYPKIHKEFRNYLEIAVPYINVRSIMGFAEEFKYLDKGAIVGGIITNEKESIESLQEYIEGGKADLLESIDKALKIYYEKIKPFKNKEKTLLDSYKESFRKKEEWIKYEDYEESDEKRKKLEYLNNEEELDGIYIRVKELLSLSKKKNLMLTTALIHGDFTFRNILISGSQDLVFIDFANSEMGHFFIDIAKLDHYIRHELIECHQREKDSNAIVKFEKIIINNDEYKDQYFQLAYSVSKKIYTIAKDLITESLKKDNKLFNQKEFDFELNLAKLYVNYWSLTYSEKFNLPFDKRVNIVEEYLNRLELDVQAL